ncbi:hypothetical protein [Microbispora sp. NPDC049125]|uniref:hypothetical protein n=1 Tax=Microbispora sp. NPDC049125 TaxID=3154929 RepID=UPI003465EA3B
MTPRILRQTMEEWAEEARVPRNLADRALRRRSRLRVSRFAGAISCAALVAAVVLLVSTVVAPRLAKPGLQDGAAKPAVVPVEPYHQGAVTVKSSDVRTDTENSPPKTMIAAGRLAVSAYYVWKEEKISAKTMRRHDVWYLLNPGTGEYEKTDWAALDVSPGLRYAAVLERDLPARRVGVLDMSTRQIVEWVDLDHPVASVSWSPDGTRLLLTAYDTDPSIRLNVSADGSSWQDPPGSRTGFHIVDVATGQAKFHAISSDAQERMPREPGDFVWSPDGMVREGNPSAGEPGQPLWRYYDLEGRPRPAPEEPVRTYQEAGISPDGRLYADGGSPPGPETVVKDVATGQVVGRQKMEQLLAWADGDHLIAVQCAGTCRNEFSNGLALVGVDGEEVVRLSAYRENTQRPGTWTPVLTPR